jgi:hypothetical protein
VSLSPPHLRVETDPVSETLCFLVFIILDDGQSPETHCRKPSDSTYSVFGRSLPTSRRGTLPWSYALKLIQWNFQSHQWHSKNFPQTLLCFYAGNFQVWYYTVHSLHPDDSPYQVRPLRHSLGASHTIAPYGIIWNNVPICNNDIHNMSRNIDCNACHHWGVYWTSGGMFLPYVKSRFLLNGGYIKSNKDSAGQVQWPRLVTSNGQPFWWWWKQIQSKTSDMKKLFLKPH